MRLILLSFCHPFMGESIIFASLRAGSNIDRNLNRIGVPFREVLGDLLFDRFVIDIASRDNGTPTDTPAA